MKKKISPVLLCVLSVLALILVCFLVMPNGTEADPHAGHDHANQPGDAHANQPGDAHANQSGGHNHADAAHNKSAKDSYELTKKENGIYTYKVISRAGHAYTAEQALMAEPTLTAISNDVIKVSGLNAKQNNLSGWAIYYNVVGEGTVSRHFNYVLASTDSKVAYLDSYKDADGNTIFRVVVCNPFQESDGQYTELAGLQISETGNPKIDYKITESGDLQVSYSADGAKQVVIVRLK